MRLKAAAVICAVCLLLSGCSRVIRGPRDEIRLYAWEKEFENGNAAELSFSDSKADFSVKSSDFSLKIYGLCSLTDENFVILNEADGIGYTFDYTLHGDCIDLSYRGDTITLDKKSEK